MLLKPKYAENIVVCTYFNDVYSWYVSEKEYWFLDLIKFSDSFNKAGYEKDSDYSWRFDISILNENTASDFLMVMEYYKVSANELRDLIMNAKGDKLEYLPALLVDFDNRRLFSLYPEPASFERFVPDGWIGKDEGFLEMIPKNLQYWIVDGKNYLIPEK